MRLLTITKTLKSTMGEISLVDHLNGLSPLVKLLHLQDLLDAGVAR